MFSKVEDTNPEIGNRKFKNYKKGIEGFSYIWLHNFIDGIIHEICCNSMEIQ